VEDKNKTQIQTQMENNLNMQQNSPSKRPKKRVRINLVASTQPLTAGTGFKVSTDLLASDFSTAMNDPFAKSSTKSTTKSTTFAVPAAPTTTSLPAPITTSLPTPTPTNTITALKQHASPTKQTQQVKQLHEEGQEFMCHANKVIKFHFPTTSAQLDAILSNATTSNIHPEYTHQLFGDDETIIGFKDLNIDLIYSASNFHLLYRETYTDRLVTIGQTPTENDIVDKLREALPDGWTRDVDAFRKHLIHESNMESESNTKSNEASFTPPGEVVFQYTSNNNEYQVRRSVPSECNAAKEMHERVETMSMYAIDGATYADLEDHRWSIYTIYNNTKRGALVGYMTVFTFDNPFRVNESSRQAMRVCQLLIMPQHQRQGHGRTLLHVAHLEIKRLNMYELTVEDPNNAFTRMRDSMDMRTCVESNYFHLNDVTWQLSTGTNLQDIRSIMRVTKGQINKCYEVLKLHTLDQTLNSPGDANEIVQNEMKNFRLSVKRRLWNAHKAELKKIEDKAVRLQAIELLWREVASSYRVTYANAFAGK
tara:strand:- start:112 stop:1722 length:1611 start_codon:yes stop_codon:yes gene_type:complete